MEKKKTKIWILVLVVVVAAAMILLGLYLGGAFRQPTRRERDAAALAGQLPGKSAEDIQATLNQVVEDGMLNITINSNPVFEDGAGSGNWNIENIPGNHYSLQVKVTLDETGETVYESKLIDPGYYIESAPLSKELPAGVYAATAVFTAVDPATEEEMGTAAAQITITILN